MNGLEALSDLRNCLQAYYTMECVPSIDEKLDIIEQELKALEIIKEKRVDIDCLIDCFQYDGFVHTNGLIEYSRSLTKDQKPLTQEEYDLLKRYYYETLY